MTRFANKTALIVGGSRGIGATVAKRLASEGADVAITYGRSADQANAVVKEIEAAGRKGHAVQADVGERGSADAVVASVIEAFGKIDILVITAGTFDVAPIGEIDDARFDKSFDVNVRGTFEIVRAAADKITDGGRIITFGSVLGDEAPFAGLALYTATKAAVKGFTRGWAREFAPRNITVNTIQPGPIDTEMNPADGEVNPVADYEKSVTAFGRFGKAEEVAALAAFVASDEASYVTGASLNVDGGWAA